MSSHRNSNVLPFCAVAVILASLAGAVRANGVTTIDFETVPGVTPTPSYFQLSEVPLESYLSDQLLNQYGVWFYSETPNAAAVAYVDLGEGHATSGSYGIGSIDTQSRIDYSIPLMASFFIADNPTQAAVTNVVGIMADQASCCETLTLEAYDYQGNFLAATTATAIPGGTSLELTHPGIHTIRVLQESASVAWDDLSFGELRPVPEPSSWALAVVATFAGWFVSRQSRRRSEPN